MGIIGIISIIILVALDQLTKLWAVSALANGEIQLWKDVFHLQYICNEGAAWGIFKGRQTFLILLTSLIILVMLYYIIKLPKTTLGKIERFSIILIISGAIGNLIDRITLGYVRDFLYFILIDFPIFNVADILVVVGVIILMVAIIWGDLKEGNIKTKEVSK